LGSLDENLIQIRIATLKRLLPIVITFGLEQKDPTAEHLMVIEIIYTWHLYEIINLI